MDKEDRLILSNEHKFLSKVKLERLSPYLKEYKIFNRYMWKDIRTTEDMLKMLPHRGPKAFQNIIEILEKADYFTEAKLLKNSKLVKKIPDGNLYYVMSSTPLGFCLIINNVEFTKHEDRTGSNVDAESLRDFFEKRDFKVTVEDNKKAEEMRTCLKTFSSQDFANVDSAIIIILSHGNQVNNKDVIYGTDGDYVSKFEICDIFNNKKCVDLQNKPKVFFFICCRGKGLDYGVETPNCLPRESTDCSEIILPRLSDMFVVHSTLPMQVSVRDDKGSFFCEELIKMLEEYYSTYDLETIIKLVNRNLQRKKSIMYHIIQAAHVESVGTTKNMMLCKKKDITKLYKDVKS